MNSHLGEFGSDTLTRLTSNVSTLLEAWANQFKQMPIRTLDVELRGANRGKWKITISLGGAGATMALDKLVKDFYDRATVVGVARASDPVLTAQQRENMAYHYREGTFNGDDPFQRIPDSPPVGARTGADEDVAAYVTDIPSVWERQPADDFEAIIAQDFRSFSRDVLYTDKRAKIEMTKI